MPLPQPLPGLVLHYSYLWHDQKQRGLEEGTKDRPCVVVSATAVAEGLEIVLAPVTHLSPRAPHDAIELPMPTKQRLGLDHSRSWVMVNDLNVFIWLGPALRPIPRRPGSYSYGFIPGKLLLRIADGVARVAETTSFRLTTR